MSEKKRKTMWQTVWLNEKDDNGDFISDWCRPVPTQETSGECFVCRKLLNVSNSGISCLKTHSKTQIHRDRMREKKSTTSIAISFAKVQTCAAATQPSTKAEIIWGLHVLENNYSFSSSDHCCETFASMFPDFMVATRIILARTKLSYLINHGIAPHIRLLNSRAMEGLPFSLQVDEVSSTNGHFLGIMARYVPRTSSLPITICLDLIKLDCSDASTITESIVCALLKARLEGSNLICVMTDNCSVMWGKFFLV